MSSAIRYYSRSGHTKNLAEAIAKGAGCEAASVEVPLKERVDVLFIGSGLYAAQLDKHLKAFLADLDPALVGKAVLFGTSSLTKRQFPQMEKALAAKGIAVEQDVCYAKGQPKAADLAVAEEFGARHKA